VIVEKNPKKKKKERKRTTPFSYVREYSYVDKDVGSEINEDENWRSGSGQFFPVTIHLFDL
jgi:hypothetical protein